MYSNFSTAPVNATSTPSFLVRVHVERPDANFTMDPSTAGGGIALSTTSTASPLSWTSSSTTAAESVSASVTTSVTSNTTKSKSSIESESPQSTVTVVTSIDPLSPPSVPATFNPSGPATNAGATHATTPHLSALSASAQTSTGLAPVIAGSTVESEGTTERQGALSKGLVGAVCVASAIGGAFVVAAIIVLLLRKRRRRGIADHDHADSYQDHSDTFSGTTAIAILEKSDLSTTTNKDVDLLPPASDFELQEDFTHLNTSIRDFVETYCTASTEVALLAQDHSVHNLDGLPELLSPDCPLSEPTLDTLLKSPSTRLPAIRFLIAWNILSNVRPDAPLSSTLLPPEISRCIEALEPIPLGNVSARPDSPFRCPSPSSMRIVSASETSSDDWLISLHKWRQVTGAAMAAIYSDGVEQQLDFRDSRKGNISELAANLIQVLQPFVVKGFGAARVKELERVVMRGAQVGWKLFVQGSTWKFGWHGSDEQGRFVVFPSLVKVGIDNGVRLVKPVVVAEVEEAEIGVGGL